MSIYSTCPCGIPEGSPEEHLRTDCPLYGTGANIMTDRALEELAARVEALTGPDREVDALICELVDLPFCEEPDCLPDVFQLIIERVKAGGEDSEIPAYTASIDAAMALVPKGLILRQYMASRFVPHSCEVSLSWGHGGWFGNSDYSFPLALTAACLRAIAGKEG